MRILRDRKISGPIGQNKNGKGQTDKNGGGSVWGAIVAALGQGYQAREERKGRESALRMQHAERMFALRKGASHIPTVFGPYSSVNRGSLDLGQLIVPAAILGGVAFMGFGALMLLKD